mgnify:CR=1 FL=1
MRFEFKVWKLIIVIDLFDLEPSDRNIKFGIAVSW